MRMFLTLLLALAATSPAAVTYVGGTSKAGNPVSTLSVSYTVSASSQNGILIASVNDFTNATTGIAWNGQSFTKLTSTAYTPGAYLGQSVWYLLLGNPTGQTANITATAGGNNDWGMVVQEYAGVNQATPFPAYAFGFNASGTNLASTITVTDANSALYSAVSYLRSQAVTAAAGFTLREMGDSGSVGGMKGYDKLTGQATGPVTVTFTSTNSAGPYETMLLAELMAATSTSNNFIPTSPYQWQRLKNLITPMRPWSFFRWLLLPSEAQAGIIDWKREAFVDLSRKRKEREYIISKYTPTITPTPDVRVKPVTPTQTPTPTPGK